MKLRTIVIRASLIVILLPLVLVLIAGVSFYASFYSLPRANGTVVSSGQEREYLLYVPRSYDRTKPTPLVISLHAAALWPATQMDISRWNEVADENGFLVVYPSGTTPSGNGTGVLPKVWLLRPEAELAANVSFIASLIDRLEATYNVDPTRIYVNGFSNGGAMAFALSCRLSRRIAAVGTVSAAHDQLPFSWCADSQPMPLINFHGTDDLVPFGGGTAWMSPRAFPSVRTWTEDWALRNRCGPSPVVSEVAVDITRLEYAECAENAAVVLYIVHGGGHSWPGGKPLPEWIVGPTSRGIDATRQMWAFFQEHRLASR